MIKLSTYKNINHFFFDGYEILNDKLNNVELISNLLDDINATFLNSNGQKIIIPYFGNKDFLDDGISGIVLGKDFHFTCHTYSNMNTIFVDLYHGNNIDNFLVINILKKYFGVEKFDLCVNNKSAGNYGKHIIIKTDIIEYQDALILIDKIIESINMHPIHEKICSVYENGYDILRPIAESHISIHCHDNCIIDVFSCNTFDDKKIVGLLSNIYSISSVERGVLFDKNAKNCYNTPQ